MNKSLIIIIGMILLGLPFASAMITCYQESALTANQTGIDGPSYCGLQYTGRHYQTTGGFIYNAFPYDGNYDFSTGVKLDTTRFWINYTIPTAASLIGSYWRVKDSVNGELNISLADATIINGRNISLVVQVQNGSVGDYDGFISYYGLTAEGNIALPYEAFTCGDTCLPEFYDEGIYWNVSPVVLINITEPKPGITTNNTNINFKLITLNSYQGTLNISMNGVLIVNSASYTNVNYNFPSGSLISPSYYNQGSNIMNFSFTDNAGYTFYNSTTFIYDTEAPTINILYPGNNQPFFNGNVDINYSVSDYSLSDCNYINRTTENPATVSQTIGLGCINLTGKTWPLGHNIVTIVANDTAGRTTYQNISFKVLNLSNNLSASSSVFSTLSIGFNGVGYDSPFCSAYTNDTRLSCSLTNAFNSYCEPTQAILNASINITPYCYDVYLGNYYIKNTTSRIYNWRYNYNNNFSIRLYDQYNGSVITKNISLLITADNNYSNTFTIQNGFLNITNLAYGNYTLKFTGTNYTTKFYSVLIDNPTLETLDAYLLNNENLLTTIFTIKDKSSGALLENAFITTFSYINNTWVVTGSAYTDITGRMEINYVLDNNYKFYINKASYQDLTFYLEPILFSSYDVGLSKTISNNNTVQLEDMFISWSPQYFKIGEDMALNITFINSESSFSHISTSPASCDSYGFYIYSFESAYQRSGCFGAGSTVQYDMDEIIGTDVFNPYNGIDSVPVWIYYNTPNSGIRNLTINIPIIYNGADVVNSNVTMMSNKDNTYGLGIFERMLIATLIVLMVMGICVLIGQLVAGFFMAIMIYGYMTFIGFIPLWIIIPSAVVAFFVLIWRSGGY